MTPTLTEAAKLAIEALSRCKFDSLNMTMADMALCGKARSELSAALAAHEALPAVGEPERANRVGDLRNAMWLDPRCASHAACQSLVFKQEHQTAVENERQQFQRETLRTSELSALLQRWVDCHEAEHGPGPWARSCDVCALVGESNALLSKPINAPQPVPSPVQAPASVAPTGDLPDDAPPADLWAEIYRLRAAVKGPDGYSSWQDAAVDERIRRVRAEKALAEMEALKDAAYLERNQVVAALAKCFPSGVARTTIESWSEDWHGCVYIDLPTGQAAWHFHDSQAYLFEGLPPYTGQWDGHDTPEKYRRLAALIASPEQELTDERIDEIYATVHATPIRYGDRCIIRRFARAVEAAIRNEGAAK